MLVLLASLTAALAVGDTGGPDDSGQWSYPYFYTSSDHPPSEDGTDGANPYDDFNDSIDPEDKNGACSAVGGGGLPWLVLLMMGLATLRSGSRRVESGA
jgi:hypothetical protein